MSENLPTRKSPADLAVLDTGEEELFALLAEGKTVAQLAERFNVGRSSLYNWRDAGGGDRLARWEAARRLSADAHVERAGAILDEAAEVDTAAKASIARARSDFHWKLAERFSPGLYGDQSPSVVVNIGQLHLAALKAANPPRVTTPTLEAEILEDDAA